MIYVARKFDDFVNRFTMYKIVLYGLMLLLFCAAMLGLAGVVTISPLSLVASAVLLGSTTYLVNHGLSRLFHVPVSSETWLITALILTCIMPFADSWPRAFALVGTGALAMVSKYIFTYRGGNIFNPAAFAAVIMGVLGFIPTVWWVANPVLLPFTAVLGFVVLYKVRRFQLFASFAATALFVMAYMGLADGQSLMDIAENAFLSWPLVFMGTIMLTEPSTTPARQQHQLAYGLIVGALFALQLSFGPLAVTPELALLIGNIFVAIVSPGFSAVIKLKKIEQRGIYYDFIFDRPPHFDFSAGQYLEWTLRHKHADIRGNRRTFSIASSPTEQELRIGTKLPEKPTSFKMALSHMNAGDTIRISRLSGNFVLPEDPKQPVVLIAGGVGVTPYRSMLRSLVDKQETRDIQLLYTAATDADFQYRDLLKQAEAFGVRTTYITDKVDSESLHKLVPQTSKKIFYISGPNKMVDYYRGLLHAQGVSYSSIKKDFFAGY